MAAGEHAARENTAAAAKRCLYCMGNGGGNDEHSYYKSPAPMQRINIATWILSIGLAAVFGFFGFDKFAEPLLWLGWMPLWMDDLLDMPVDSWLMVVGAIEVIVAILVLVPVWNVRRAGAVLMTLQLLAILPIAGFNDIGLRDFAMMMNAITLAALSG